MSPIKQRFSVSYIYNGPHTIVSTMPNGYSVTIHGIKIDDENLKLNADKNDECFQQDLLEFSDAKSD